jgi:rhomboid-like protein
MACVAAYPRALSIIGANFRHDTVRHLAPNLVCLWLFGLTLHDDVGRGTFLAIYMGAGVFGGYSSLAYSVLRKDFYAYIYGSSQAVLGVFAAACMLKPNRKMQILGYEIPVAVWVFLTLFTAGEAYAAVRGLNTTINHAGHVAGLVAGGAMALALRLRGEHPEAASTADGVVHMKRVNLEDGR